MGTWGTGPLDNDTADDLLDELEPMPVEHRLSTLEAIFNKATEVSAEDGGPILPDQVLAAAAVVAANTPAGASLPWLKDQLEDHHDLTAWLGSAITKETAEVATQALVASLPQDSWYWQSWVDEAERNEAMEEFQSLLNVLRQYASR